MLQLVPGDRDQNGLLGPLDRSTHVAVPDESVVSPVIQEGSDYSNDG